MIGSIAQGYAARALLSITSKVLRGAETENGGTAQDTFRDGTTGKAGPDTLALSNRGKLLAANELLLPTAANIQALSTTLARDMAALLAKQGISSAPSFEVDVDERTMDITVKGDRNDKAAIAQAINGDETIKNGIRTLAAISSHAAAMTGSMNFQKEYMASTNSDNIVSRYASLFQEQKGNDISIRFDGTNVAVLANGQEYMSART
ncbi:MAG: hypothetical protein PHC90_06705 [Syntrophorhabdaceae bacterium]|nr:hypothetical protein [Syntrophorhabdaceae bacterium]